MPIGFLFAATPLPVVGLANGDRAYTVRREDGGRWRCRADAVGWPDVENLFLQLSGTVGG